MTRGTTIAVALLALVAGAVVTIGLLRLTRFVEGPDAETTPTVEAPETRAAPPAEGHIKAQLYYAAEDGEHLVAVERDVPLAATPLEQARRIVEAQLAPAPAPQVSVIPPGTTLRAFFLTGDGRAIVDLSPEVRTAHPGGTTNELLTVYAIVDALAVNLPAISGVYLLVDGEPMENLAGHVDVRSVLRKRLDLAP